MGVIVYIPNVDTLLLVFAFVITLNCLRGKLGLHSCPKW